MLVFPGEITDLSESMAVWSLAAATPTHLTPAKASTSQGVWEGGRGGEGRGGREGEETGGLTTGSHHCMAIAMALAYSLSYTTLTTKLCSLPCPSLPPLPWPQVRTLPSAVSSTEWNLQRTTCRDNMMWCTCVGGWVGFGGSTSVMVGLC